ncbi:hypothetical protein [Enteractinococcus helveticum]|uniref:Uncharacterized protein n=1 Tax=Enteractinococcus helveticum TaxID=1837282 RepID=A0A1B7LXQ8_9MICC|nr:hypothetical protein [Enteractinococcus helveticum]OAV59953.1 hypothetical protein A6F49_14525 [Enteractinococcus helveticum]
MANIQERVTKAGVTTHRVDYYDDNEKFKYTPTPANQRSSKNKATTLPWKFLAHNKILMNSPCANRSPDLAIRAIEITNGTTAEYEREAART